MPQKYSENPASTRVRWAELLPDDFMARMLERPVVYLPLGLCEPHGHIAALGLDTIKAEYYCEEAARRCGGIVAPTHGYHIHECGFHAAWLASVVGEQNPLLAALPPHVMALHFLYLLRAFYNTGFDSVVVVSGHAGGSQIDLRRVAALFAARTAMPVTLKTDVEWLGGLHPGDHAGKYEISQLMAIRPDLIDLSRLDRAEKGGRLALGSDAAEANGTFGHQVNETILKAICSHVTLEVAPLTKAIVREPMTYATTEGMWKELQAQIPHWHSVSPTPGVLAPQDSRWAPYESVGDLLSPSA